MATRTSTRHAAQKAKEAISAHPDTKRRGSNSGKRKGSTEKGPEPKRGKKEDYDEVEKHEDVQNSVPTENVNLGEKEVAKPEEKLEEKNEVSHEEKLEEKPQEPKPEQVTSVKPDEKPEEKSQEKLQQKPHETNPEQKPEVKPEEEPVDKPDSEVLPASPNAADVGGGRSHEREDFVPSNILEKGIIYFFYRSRVNVSEPQSFADVARSFFVLRPTPLGAAPEHEKGPVGINAKCRLMMLPKKRFPTTGREREMGFVEKTGKSMKEIHESFVPGKTYETATLGTREVPEATPYAEGVYAITSTKKATHLVYVLTIPEEIGAVQEDFGLRARGSWLIQSKNPVFPGPPFAQLPKEPEYPESVREKFKEYRWIPMEPELIDYPNAQFLMIGSVAGGGLGKAAAAGVEEKQPEEERPGEELIKMEDENEARVETLGGDHAIYQDLGSNAQSYPKVQTTWDKIKTEAE